MLNFIWKNQFQWLWLWMIGYSLWMAEKLEPSLSKYNWVKLRRIERLGIKRTCKSNRTSSKPYRIFKILMVLLEYRFLDWQSNYLKSLSMILDRHLILLGQSKLLKYLRMKVAGWLEWCLWHMRRQSRQEIWLKWSAINHFCWMASKSKCNWYLVVAIIWICNWMTI